MFKSGTSLLNIVQIASATVADVARTRLDRAQIVAAALALLDEGGLEAVTARALAARLGVQAGALYYHLPDMRALLDEVATELLRQMVTQPGAEVMDGWEGVLRRTATRVRTVLTSRRDGARVFAGSRITDDTLLTAMESPLAALTTAGFPLEEAVWALQTVLHLTVGFVIEEQHRRDDEPRDYRPEARRARIDAAAAPLTAAATGSFLADADRQFAFGVGVLVDGMRLRLPH